MISPRISGSIRALRDKIDELVEHVNGLFNIRIVRGGVNSEDTVAVSKSGVVIKLRGFPDGVAGVPGIKGDHMLIYRAGQTTPDLVAISDIMEGYDPEEGDNWSIEFGVTDSVLDDFTTTPPTFVSDTEIHDKTSSGATQTYFRIPVIRTLTVDEESTKLQWDVSKVYREYQYCEGSKGLVAGLIPQA